MRASTAWVDIDDEGAAERLAAFAHRPHLVVASGSGGRHGYWRLDHPVPARGLEQLNRKLCAALGGDQASTDRGRIMRLPGTVNHKARKPCRIPYCDLAAPGYRAAELVRGLKDPAPASPSRRRRPNDKIAEDELADVPAPVYFEALTGIPVADQGGHVRCPLPDHDEEIASCIVYAEDRGWFCFGCGAGGSIYDLASALLQGPTGRELRGEAFKEARRFAAEKLGVELEAAPDGRARSREARDA